MQVKMGGGGGGGDDNDRHGDDDHDDDGDDDDDDDDNDCVLRMLNLRPLQRHRAPPERPVPCCRPDQARPSVGQHQSINQKA